jgi:hypothetical protein
MAGALGAANHGRVPQPRFHRSDRHHDEVDASEVAHHDRTHANHDALETHLIAPPDPLLPTFPSSPRFPAPSTPDRLPWFPTPSTSCSCSFLTPSAAPPPAFHHHAWAVLPVFVLQVEEGVSSASAVDTPSSKPRRGAKSESEARRRPRDLLRPSARDHHLEATTLRGLHTPVARVRALRSRDALSRAGRRPLQLTGLPLRLDAGRRGSSESRPVSVEA